MYNFDRSVSETLKIKVHHSSFYFRELSTSGTKKG